MANMTRIQFDVSDEKVKEFEDVMKEADIPNRRDFFNNAVALFEWAINEKRQGRSIISVGDGGDEKEIIMPSLETVAKRTKVGVNAKPKPVLELSPV